MGLKPRINKAIMKQLVQEIEIVRMSEAEALKYIEIKLGRRISAQTLYEYKRQIKSEPERNAWLSFMLGLGLLIIIAIDWLKWN